MSLPEEALEELRKAAERLVEVGDVWWLPEENVKYPGGKDRFCLLVVLELGRGESQAVRAHFVVGSTRRSSGPTTVRLAAGEAGVHRDTYFRFSWSGSVDLRTLVKVGEWKGRLGEGGLAEIETAIKASKRVVLKRLIR